MLQLLMLTMPLCEQDISIQDWIVSVLVAMPTAAAEDPRDKDDVDSDDICGVCRVSVYKT